MTLLEAAVLGLVQGLTEFLPVSSTAHLRIVPELFGWKDPGAAYSAIIQLGTVGSVLVYFFKDQVRLARAFVQGLVRRAPLATVDSRLAWFVLLGTVPIGVAGLIAKPWIETSLRSLYVVSAALILLALVLWLAEVIASHRRTVEEMTLRDGLFIGLCQAVALIPGSSRSGTTLTAGLALGLRRADAARFSFLLSIPATTLAGVFELSHLLKAADRPSALALWVGTGVAFASGMAAIAGLLRFLRSRTTLVFVAYRLALGLLILGMLWSGRLTPSSGLENLTEDAKPHVPLRKQVTD